MRTYFTFLVILSTFFIPVTVFAEQGLTEKTGQEILKELKAVRAALEKQPVAAAQAAPIEAARGQQVKVSVKGSHALGSEKAPLTLVEFTDYQCPFCKRFFDTTFPEIKKNFIDTGKLRFVSRNLPLPMHQHATKAAQAAMCAGDQGKYWQMREQLFNNSRALEPEKLTSYAEKIRLNMKKFNKCVASDAHLAKIDEDAKDAQSVGIGGTPSFILGKNVGNEFIEGEKIVGAQPYGAFEARIKSALQETN